MAEITLEKLQEQLDKQAETIAAQHETILGLKGEVAKTNLATEPVKPPTIPSKPTTYKGKEYKWQVAIFHLPGSPDKITAEEANLDENIIKQVLAIEGQGMLKELV